MSNQGQDRPAQWQNVFAAGAGLWLAVALIKFGNPVILDHQVTAPTSFSEALMVSWPALWAYCLSITVLIIGWDCGRRPAWWLAGLVVAFHWLVLPAQVVFWDAAVAVLALIVLYAWRRPAGLPRWQWIVPLVWLGWQCIAALRSLSSGDSGQSRLILMTLQHFAICVLSFYLGARIASPDRAGPATAARPGPEPQRLFWLSLGGGFLIVLAVAWRQHFGGLEETRQFFFTLPNWRSYPPEFIEKLSSDRIYGTLFYPNALAGVILLLLPIVAVRWWLSSMGLRPRIGGLAAIVTLALGALYWSGSKAGWLICLTQALVGGLWLGPGGRKRWFLAAIVLAVGLAGFGLRYRAYLARGATSVTARFDYWDAAWQGLLNKPAFGSGPGTFAKTYRELKRPEAEMTRLTHNDFLQQGSDSGVVGLLAYAVWLLGGVGALSARLRPRQDLNQFALWLGLAGIILQGFLEFWLYIPAIAWPTLFLFGLALTTRPPLACATTGNPIDKGWTRH